MSNKTAIISIVISVIAIVLSVASSCSHADGSLTFNPCSDDSNGCISWEDMSISSHSALVIPPGRRQGISCTAGELIFKDNKLFICKTTTQFFEILTEPKGKK